MGSKEANTTEEAEEQRSLREAWAQVAMHRWCTIAMRESSQCVGACNTNTRLSAEAKIQSPRDAIGVEAAKVEAPQAIAVEFRSACHFLLLGFPRHPSLFRNRETQSGEVLDSLFLFFISLITTYVLYPRRSCERASLRLGD